MEGTKINKQDNKDHPITKQMVFDAYKKVRTKGKAIGVDQESLETFERNLGDNLYVVWNRLASGSYFPSPVKRVEIPKADGKKRPLGIPTIRDKIAQIVLKDYLEPRFEAIFHKDSYGYRPLKSAHQAVKQVRSNCYEYAWVVDLDIKGFFDNIDHELLMRAVKKHVEEKWVCMYIERFLKAPIQDVEGNLIENEGKGISQGCVTSPMLANLFLHYTLDKWLNLKFPHVCFVRYADDIIIHASTQNEAKRILQAVKERLAQCGLQLHPDKTKVVYAKNYKRKLKWKHVSFDFLGFSFHPQNITLKNNGGRFLGFGPDISRQSRSKIIQTIRETKLLQMYPLTLEEIAKNLNPKLRGWINYFGAFGKSNLLYTLYKGLDFHVTRWVARKYKKGWRKATEVVERIKRAKPKLFTHWSPSAELELFAR